MNSLPKIVNRQRRGCDLNPGPSAPESSTLTTRLPSRPFIGYMARKKRNGERRGGETGGAEGENRGRPSLKCHCIFSTRSCPDDGNSCFKMSCTASG